jgi:hypothetical protein
LPPWTTRNHQAAHCRRSVRAIAKAEGSPLADVNRALDLFTEATFNDKVRKHTLVLELARLDLSAGKGRRRAIGTTGFEAN